MEKTQYPDRKSSIDDNRGKECFIDATGINEAYKEIMENHSEAENVPADR